MKTFQNLGVTVHLNDDFIVSLWGCNIFECLIVKVMQKNICRIWFANNKHCFSYHSSEKKNTFFHTNSRIYSACSFSCDM